VDEAKPGEERTGKLQISATKYLYKIKANFLSGLNN
jgi:hypothetical protein